MRNNASEVTEQNSYLIELIQQKHTTAEDFKKLSANIQDIILSNPNLVRHLLSVVKFSELTQLSESDLIRVLRNSGRMPAYLLETKIPLSGLLVLSDDMLGVVLICTRGYELVTDGHVSLQEISNVPDAVFRRVMNFIIDSHSYSDGHGRCASIQLGLAVNLIKACQPGELLTKLIQMDNHGFLQSTIRELWKETRQHNIAHSSGFICVNKEISYAERTYREMQKSFENKTLSQKNRIGKILDPMVMFVTNSAACRQPFAVALDKRFKLGIIEEKVVNDDIQRKAAAR